MFFRIRALTEEEQPRIELVSDDPVADLAACAGLHIDLFLAFPGGCPSLEASLPDRGETVARGGILPPDRLRALGQAMERAEGRFALHLVDETGAFRAPWRRPGDAPFPLDPRGDLAAWRGGLAAGDLIEARLRLDNLAAHAPRFPMLPLFDAITLAAEGEGAAALEACRRELSFRPGNHLAHGTLGALLRETGDPAGAQAAHVAALRLHPCHVPSLLALAALLDGIDNLLPLLARLLAIDPERTDLAKILVERERAFGGMSREQVLDRARRLALATPRAAPLFLPGLAKPGMRPPDGTEGSLSSDEILRYCLEEIMADGALEAREREILNTLRETFGVDAERYRALHAEAEKAVRGSGASRGAPLEEARLYRRVLDRALADGRVTSAERGLLARLAAALLVTRQEHEAILRRALADRGHLV